MCEAPATPDSRCASVNLGALGAAAGGLTAGFGRGCCTPSNQCGLDGSIFGRGCVDNAEASSMLAAIPFIGTLIMVPASKTCDTPLTTTPPATDDAGSADAGL